MSASAIQSSENIESGAESLTEQALVGYINKNQELWKAEVYNFTVEQLKRMVIPINYAVTLPEYRAPEMSIDAINETLIPDRQVFSLLPRHSDESLGLLYFLSQI